jgi:transketolase
MLNSELHLNTKLFDTDVEKHATRDGYGEGIVTLGEKDQNVVVLSADLTESTRADAFAKKFPERFFNMGVAEQNMAAVAAGLGVSGKTAFLSSYATFSPGKNWETIRTTAVYNHANVKIAGHHAGVMTGPDGATHQATEDIAITRVWPGIDVLVPCDSIEARKATIAAGEKYGPVYLRYSRDKTPVITTDKTPFEIGRLDTYWISKNPQVVIFATGYMLYYALLAAHTLKEEIDVLVANVSSIKPLDEHHVVSLLKNTGAAVTVEDHQIAGGLGGLIAETAAKHFPVPIEFVGLRDTFAESGQPDELLVKYEMDAHAIIKAVHMAVGRK